MMGEDNMVWNLLRVDRVDESVMDKRDSSVERCRDSDQSLICRVRGWCTRVDPVSRDPRPATPVNYRRVVRFACRSLCRDVET